MRAADDLALTKISDCFETSKGRKKSQKSSTIEIKKQGERDRDNRERSLGQERNQRRSTRQEMAKCTRQASVNEGLEMH